MNQSHEVYNFHRIHEIVKYKSPDKFLLKQGINRKIRTLKVPQIHTLSMKFLSNN
jgi:hypothetical protein